MNAPKLRFNGFDNNWEIVCLGDISSVTKLAGFEFTKYVTYSNNGTIIALRGLNVKKGLLDLSDVKYIDGSDFTKLTRSKLYKNDLLFTYVGTIGEAAIVDVDDKYYLAPNVCLIRPSQVESAEFLLEYILNENFKRKIIDPLVTTSSQPSLSMENVRKFSINIPSIEEQKKISSFIEVINKKIQLQQEKIDLLKEQKKGYMQKIFSQELRFKDDEGVSYPEWEKKYLKELSDVRDGTHDSPKYYPTGYPLITSKNLNSNGTLNNKDLSYISQEDYEKINKRSLVEDNDILFGMIGTIGNAVKVSNPNFAIKNVALIKDNTEKFNEFLIHFLKSFYIEKQFNLLLAGGTQKFIGLNDIRNLDVLVPCQDEQKKIAQFLSTLDKKIALNEESLNRLIQQKQAFMQQMFI